MNAVSSYRSTIAIVLLLTILGGAALSAFILNDLNEIVPSKLYNFGLSFNSNWGLDYLRYINLAFISLTCNVVLVSLATIFMIIYMKTSKDDFRFLSSLLIVFAAFTNLLSIVAYDYVSSIVNSVFYNYGLQFSNVWYTPLQWHTISFLFLQVVLAVLDIACLALIYLSSKTPAKISFSRAVSFSLLIAGVGILALSLLYNSFISLLIGISLMFWGTSLSYASSNSYVKRDVAVATSLSYLTSLSEMLKEREPLGELIYLPAGYSKEAHTNKVWVANSPVTETIGSQSILQEEDWEKHAVELKTAPGSELLRLFEITLHKNFAKTNYAFFERALPALIVENLELAQNVRVDVKDNLVKVTIENPLETAFFVKAKNYKRTIDFIGAPLSSAIACALANCTKKPIIIKSHSVSLNGKAVEITYMMLDIKEGKA